MSKELLSNCLNEVSGYKNLSPSCKLRVLNFLCDETLQTEWATHTTLAEINSVGYLSMCSFMYWELWRFFSSYFDIRKHDQWVKISPNWHCIKKRPTKACLAQRHTIAGHKSSVGLINNLTREAGTNMWYLGFEPVWVASQLMDLGLPSCREHARSFDST
jgi:hypothetical protein